MNRMEKLSHILTVQKQNIHQTIKPHLKEGILSFLSKVYEKYLHSYETRKPQEIKATVDNTYKLTEKNLKRLNSLQTQIPSLDKQKFKNFIFICLNGIPAFKNEFAFLNLPGKVYEVVSTGFELDKDEEFRQQNLPNCRFGFNADKIHEIVKSNPQKGIIFVYHSFGTYNLSVYFHKYGTQRVKGLIEIGAAPVRQYLYITEVTNYAMGFTQEDLIRNKNDVAGKGLRNLMDRVNKELNVRWDYFPTVTYGASFLSYFKSPESPILFDLNRRYPNILKLMIFGQEDNIFQQELICERAAFYSQHKINNQPELKQKYKQKYGISTQKLQQNFFFMIPKGKHSVHLQKKNQPVISKAVNEYLDLILS